MKGILRERECPRTQTPFIINLKLLNYDTRRIHPDALSNKEQQLFNKALHHLRSARYEPRDVATHIVPGTNYRFICNAQLPGKEEPIRRW